MGGWEHARTNHPSYPGLLKCGSPVQAPFQFHFIGIHVSWLRTVRSCVPGDQCDLRECHLSMVTVRVVGDGFDHEWNSTRKGHGLQTWRISPEARGLQDV